MGKVLYGSLTAMPLSQVKEIHKHMFGTWLTHDWKAFKTWALTQDLPKKYIS